MCLLDGVGLARVSPLLPAVHAAISSKHSELYHHLTSVQVSEPNRVIKNAFFDTTVNAYLRRGLCGLLPLPTVMYVWDQCQIAGFNVMLSIVVTALLCGCAEEMLSLSHLPSMNETFVSFCSQVDVDVLQRYFLFILDQRIMQYRLVSDHCADELKNIFDIEGTYELSVNEETKLLQVILYLTS